MIDLHPVLTESLVMNRPSKPPVGVSNGGIEPTGVDCVVQGIAGRSRHGEDDSPMAAVGIRLGGRIHIQAR